jgi:hypothetical protein
MNGIISASVKAGPLFQSSDGIVIMSGLVYIHELTPEVARQWLPTIERIAGEK